MIYQTVNEWEFIRAFQDMGRGDQFSREGLRALFEYLDDASRDLGEDVELDVIALCCEWTEYDSIEDAAESYLITPDQLQEDTLVLFVGPDESGPVVILDY